MAKLRRIEKKEGQDGPDFMFWCPACHFGHAVWTEKKNHLGAVWTFNGNMEKPTFTPSLMIRTPLWTPPVTPENMEQWKKEPWVQTQITNVCHTNITDGVIVFHPDCTHAMAGKEVPMEDF